MEVSGITLRVIRVKHVAVVIGSRGYQLSEAKVAFDDKTRLDPLVSTYLFCELDRLQITYRGVIVVVTVRLQFLIIRSGSD